MAIGIMEKTMDKRSSYPKAIPALWRLRYSRSKAQAKYRKEPWEFNIESWYKFWQDSGLTDRLGRGLDSVVMIRKDRNLPWNLDNCIIIARSRQLWKLGRENFTGNREDITGYALYQKEEK
jgi:hypothetical protein